MAPSLLFIPDISGFTKFVNTTEVAHGRHVIAELLDLIIGSDELGLTVSELEGDAVFFYRDGPLPSFEALVDQAQKTFQAFHAHLKAFESRRICDCGACSTAHELSLKIVAHAGPIELISVRGFEKPYGSDVIVAHRLLKNDLDEHEYLLVTDIALEAAPASGTSSHTTLPAWVEVHTHSAEVDDVGSVPYRWVPLAPLLRNIPEPDPPRAFAKMKAPMAREVFIDRDPDELFELISNLDLRLSWNHDVLDVEYEPDRVNRVGTHHRCAVGRNVVDFETVTNDFGDGRRVYGEYVADNPLVHDLVTYYIVEPEGSGSRLRFELHYRAKAFPLSLLALPLRFWLGRIGGRLLTALKEAAESAVGAIATDPIVTADPSVTT
jgi:Protein of unknown function (DUF2652)/Polyketide cyclase / dehydrase and lipid transport